MAADFLQLGSDSLGGYLTDPTYVRELSDAIIATPVMLQVFQTLPMTRRKAFIAKTDTLPVPGWVQEGAAKPQGDMAFSQMPIECYEIAQIVTFSERMLVESFLDAKSMVKGAVSQAIGRAIDLALIAGDQTTTTDACPTGILNQSGFEDIDFGDHGDSNMLVSDDIRFAIRTIRKNNFSPNTIICHSVVLDLLQSYDTADGMPKFPSVHSANPSLFGLRIVQANNIPLDTTTYGDASDVIVCDSTQGLIGIMGSTFKFSDSAVDTDGRSYWSMDLVGVRATANVSSILLKNPTAFAVIRDVIA